jgi:nitroreductase
MWKEETIMADLLEMLYQRRSIRKYTGEAVPDELLEKVIMAGLASETSRNRRSWEFIVVRDKAMLAKMAHFRQHSALMLEGADAAVVVLGDEEKSDVWTEDCSIAMAHMHLMADQLGLGSCWIQGRNRRCEDDSMTSEAYLRELLGFPHNMRLEAVLSLGMIEQHPEPHTEESLKWEKIHREKWTQIFRA